MGYHEGMRTQNSIYGISKLHSPDLKYHKRTGNFMLILLNMFCDNWRRVYEI